MPEMPVGAKKTWQNDSETGRNLFLLQELLSFSSVRKSAAVSGRMLSQMLSRSNAGVPFRPG